MPSTEAHNYLGTIVKLPSITPTEGDGCNRIIVINSPSNLSYQLPEQIRLLSDFPSTHALVNVLIHLARLLRFTPAD